MKSLIFSVLMIFNYLSTSFGQKIIFLHHSTGAAVYSEGNVDAWISNYNSQHQKNYQLTEFNYPNDPYPWANYPYDYWNLWINKACNPDTPNIECLNNLAQKYDMIIFKHCFPGAAIEADQGTPTISSDRKSLENYKVQYRALRTELDKYPDNKFIVWTLVPLHRLATDEDQAKRAKQFVDWVKTEWLTEDSKPHPNIYIFDFWGYVAETNPNPANGKVNCLKYNYEKDHNDSDSHPNVEANLYVGPLFAEFIVNTIENSPTIIKGLKNAQYQLVYNKQTKLFTFFAGGNSISTPVYLTISDILGRVCLRTDFSNGRASAALRQGIYVVKVESGNAVLLLNKMAIN